MNTFVWVCIFSRIIADYVFKILCTLYCFNMCNVDEIFAMYLGFGLEGCCTLYLLVPQSVKVNPKMEAAYSSETFVYKKQVTWHSTKNHSPYSHCCINLRFFSTVASFSLLCFCIYFEFFSKTECICTDACTHTQNR
jgi:hypothetical protein